jgi:predicted metal-dependent hydrolase/CheY-like chemotaxis protein
MLLESAQQDGSGHDWGRPAVVCLAPDLFFGARLVDVIRACGGRPVMAETPETFVAAVDRYFPWLALLDLNTEGDWELAIRRIKLRPHTAQTPLYAFGSHVEVETLKRARQAGADHAWARSKMMEELVSVVQRHVSPPVAYPDGWDAPLSEPARHGIEEFNAREYFEQHEWLEKAWLEEQRPVREMYQGILQVGVAFLQVERGNWAGAIKLLRRGLPRLRTLPPVCQGVDVASLRAASEAIHAELVELGAQRLGEFDRGKLPRIGVVNPT